MTQHPGDGGTGDGGQVIGIGEDGGIGYLTGPSRAEMKWGGELDRHPCEVTDRPGLGIRRN